ncbi:MAG: type II secretion system F family protein [Phycisphaerae bacterium]|nr:type II secretion system F family protein [Phycisphaerae bacterium]
MAKVQVDLVGEHLVPTLALLVGVIGAVWLGARPLIGAIAAQEAQFNRVLRGALLLDVNPRMMTILWLVAVAVAMFLGYLWLFGLFGLVVFGALAALSPRWLLWWLRRRRLRQLEEQLVGGIRTVGSGVRAGLNLVQSMELVANEGPRPLRQEFAHLLHEYEYGMSLDEAMRNAADRIGSQRYRLLFAALLTHRQRGGDLGETLDRIAASIREIEHLHRRLNALTAQGRYTAMALGAMPPVLLGMIWLLISRQAVEMLFTDSLGKVVLVAIAVLTILGFLWIRKIMAVDL